MTVTAADLSTLTALVRRNDRDRFATAMFADVAVRADLLALYGFNAELGQIRQQVREPLAGMIRLQWWRDVVDGTRAAEAGGHPAGGPFLAVLERRQLPLTLVHRLLDGRERDFDAVPFATTADWLAYGGDTSGALAQLAAHILGAPAAGAHAAGTAWALTGLLRSLAFHLAQGWLTLPQDCLADVGLQADQVLAAKADQGRIAAAVLALLPRIEDLLAQAGHLGAPRRALPALLPAVLARAHLRRLRAVGGNAFDSRAFRPQPMPLRLLWAVLRGRV